METNTTTDQIIQEHISKVCCNWYSRYLRRWLTHAWLVFSDLLALFLTCTLSLLGAHLMGRNIGTNYLWVMVVLAAFLISIYAINRLYPGVGLSPPNEIRKITRSTSAGMALIAIYLFVSQQGLRYSRLVFLLFWIFALILVPIMRLLARRFGVIIKAWYKPVAIIGNGKEISAFQDHLGKNRLYGFVPMALVNFGPEFIQSEDEKKGPVVIKGDVLLTHKSLLSKMGIDTAFILPKKLPHSLQELMLYEEVFGIRQAIVIPELSHIGGSAIMPYDLQGVMGLEVQRNLFLRRFRILKRFLNIALTVLTLPIILPISFLLALTIRLDSDGPVIYNQERLGYNGEPFHVWKFRTMVKGADEILADYLEENPDMKEEWEESHKLKDDPRVTRVGKFLRKTSLDELPQLWNVIKGEMSLVGPRPIVEDEIKHFGDRFTTYTKVKPGMTGLWQVSGRSDTSYTSRVSLDEYYVRHWSIWLDFYILLRTVYTVLFRHGAY